MSQTERREEPRNQNTNREKRGTKKPEYKQTDDQQCKPITSNFEQTLK